MNYIILNFTPLVLGFAAGVIAAIAWVIYEAKKH